MEKKRTKLPLLATRVINTPLMIEPDKLHIILQVIGDRIGLVPDLSIDADMAASGITLKPRDDKAPTPKTIAVIPVYGTLVYRSGDMDALSGLTSYEDIRSSFTKALEDPNVEGIVFDIDSPGGEATGVFDLVDTIYEARGKKPIYAMANEIAYSAAYAIASAADKIYLPRTGTVGSIGVIAIHTDQSGYDEKLGVKYTSIYAGKHKNDFSPHKELSDEARASLQEKIDEMYALFIETVARNRGIKTTIVKSTEANVYQGAHAVDIGLADAILTWQDMFETITIEGGKQKMADLTLEILKADHSELYELILQEGRALVTLEAFKDETDALTQDAAQKERARIMGIITKAYGEGMAAKFGPVIEPGASITDLMEFAQDKAKADMLEKITQESPETLGQVVTTEDDTSQLTGTEKYQAEYAKSPDLQKEFGTVERYVAFKEAEAAGKVKILKDKES